MLLDSHSAVEGDNALGGPPPAGGNREIRILPDRSGRSLHFTLAISPGPQLEPEEKIPIAPNGYIYFQQEERSAIVGSDNFLILPWRPARYEANYGLRLKQLNDTTIHDLGVHMANSRDVDWLDVMLDGESKDILLSSGGKGRQIARNALALGWAGFGAALSFLGLVASLIGTFPVAGKLLRPAGKTHRKKSR